MTVYLCNVLHTKLSTTTASEQYVSYHTIIIHMTGDYYS